MGGTLFDHAIDTIEGEYLSLGVFRGLPLLLCNTGSQGPARGRLRALEQLHATWCGAGLTVIAVPSDDFGGEPGETERVQARYRIDHGVTYLVTRPMRVAARPEPLFRALCADSGRPVRSDGELFVVDGEGYVAERYGPEVGLDAPELLATLRFVLPTMGY